MCFFNSMSRYDCPPDIAHAHCSDVPACGACRLSIAESCHASDVVLTNVRHAAELADPKYNLINRRMEGRDPEKEKIYEEFRERQRLQRAKLTNACCAAVDRPPLAHIG